MRDGVWKKCAIKIYGNNSFFGNKTVILSDIFAHEKGQQTYCLLAFLAEEVGFEPTVPCGTPDFESGSLWPLRYPSVWNFLVFKPISNQKILISSQARYDLFDTAPYLFINPLLPKTKA